MCYGQRGRSTREEKEDGCDHFLVKWDDWMKGTERSDTGRTYSGIDRKESARGMKGQGSN